MIYFIGILCGILNGLFASGAGQILVVYLIFFMKKETHLVRAVSVAVLATSSIFAIIGYSSFAKYDITKVIVLGMIAAISGFIGAKLMKKIPATVLNLTSGILIVLLTCYKIFFGGK
ncbi:MAG: sulfite exporter TauE/SafE family protein [Clostridia bacterium]|nr:sulfite exporter TauE/SafE family protein [Clostridia bacterium]